MIVMAQRLTVANARNKMKADSGGNSSNSLPVDAPARMDRTPVIIPKFQTAAARMGHKLLRNGTSPKRDSNQIPVPIPAQVAHP